MTIKLSNMSSVDLITYYIQNNIKIASGKTIRFDKVKADVPNSTHIQITAKSPEITVINGKSRFDHLYVREFDPWGDPEGQKTEIDGSLTVKIDYVDTNDTGDGDRRKIEYITFLSSLDYDQWEDIRVSPSLKLPGEVPEDLVKMNFSTIWKSIVLSEKSTLVAIPIVSVTIIFAYLYRRGKSGYLKP